ncbi:hypothetical protein [Leptolyngbya sp. 7M]|uniref:hypothetical protein n=1 Tax=Leptolyngbya sp. 7M TaxID=2812896 RepID=UPI001B8A907D|nr:hypothetical protein [Leptolyngbya sp. 7M]QYO62355.1 hypothetical protein JVX88_19915 [Leptolyngbya sp. 7M]
MLKTQPLLLETPYLDNSSNPSNVLDVDWPTRLATVEQQMQQLTQQVQQLERRIATHYTTNDNLANLSLAVAVPLPGPLPEDEVDDEPDEILWDFMEPSNDP